VWAQFRTLSRQSEFLALPSPCQLEASERGVLANKVVEMAPGHAVGDKVEAAYRRGDLFERRRLLMQQWATYCTRAPVGAGEVISIRTGR
jgi:hypothetical protein